MTLTYFLLFLIRLPAGYPRVQEWFPSHMDVGDRAPHPIFFGTILPLYQEPDAPAQYFKGGQTQGSCSRDGGANDKVSDQGRAGRTRPKALLGSCRCGAEVVPPEIEPGQAFRVFRSMHFVTFHF